MAKTCGFPPHSSFLILSDSFLLQSIFTFCVSELKLVRPAGLASEQTSTAFLDMDRTSHTMAQSSRECSSFPQLLSFCSYSQPSPGISFPIRKFFTVFDVGMTCSLHSLTSSSDCMAIQQTVVTGADLKGTREEIMICLHV